MAGLQRGLGKGLGALLGASAAKENIEEILMLALDSISPNPHQPRKIFSDASLQELAQSIAAQGIIQPILVRRKDPLDDGLYELIAGERRWRAAKLACLDSIPALIKNVSDEDSLTYAMIENLQREDLNPIDEAQGLFQLQERLGCSQDALGQKIGKSRPAVANAFRLLQLPVSLQADVSEGRLSAGHGRALLAIDSPEAQSILRDRILEQGYSVREVEAQVNYWREHGEFPSSPFVPPSPRTKTHKAKTAEQDDTLKELQIRLSQSLGASVILRGTRAKGQLVLAFNSEEQLYTLIDLLGVSS